MTPEPKKEVIVREKMDKKKMIVNKVLYVVLGIILVYILTSADVHSEAVEAEKTFKEEIKEPVIVEKIVTVQEPYTEKVPISKEGCDYYFYEYNTLPEDTKLMKGDAFADEETGENYIRCNFTVINLEKKEGSFTFFSRRRDDQTKTIPAEGSASFQWIHNVEPGDLFCQIEIVQSKLPKIWKCLETGDTTYSVVTKYREVTKKQNTTEYRGTGEYKTVTKVVSETKYTYTNRVFGYKQFFYLGY